MFGLPAMVRVLNALAYGGRDPQLVRELGRLSKLVAGRGACHHPDGTAQLVASALETFPRTWRHTWRELGGDRHERDIAY